MSRADVARFLAEAADRSTALGEFIENKFAPLSRGEPLGGFRREFIAEMIARYGLRNPRGGPAKVADFRRQWKIAKAAKAEEADRRRGRAAAKDRWAAAISVSAAMPIAEKPEPPRQQQATQPPAWPRSLHPSISPEVNDSDLERIFAKHRASLPPLPNQRPN